MNRKLWKGIGWGLFFSAILWGLIFLGISQATTYYVRPDGIVLAADKANATSCSATSTTLSIAQVNLATFSGDDIIDGCGTSYTHRAQITVPSSGTSGHQTTFRNFKIYGSQAISSWDQVSLTPETGNTFNETYEGPGEIATWTPTIGNTSSMDYDNTEITFTDGGTYVNKLIKAAANTNCFTSTDLGAEKAITYTRIAFDLTAEGLADTNSGLRLLTAYDGSGVADANRVWQLHFGQAAGVVRLRFIWYDGGALGSDGVTNFAQVSISTGTKYQIWVMYDTTNHQIQWWVNGSAQLGPETMAETHKSGVRYLGLGDMSVAYTYTLYVDRIAVDTTKVLADTVTLPANAWKASCTSDPSAVWFNTPATNTWGVEETVITNLTAEYEWHWVNGNLVVYSTTDPGTTYTGVEAAARDYGIYAMQKDYITIDGFQISYARISGIKMDGYTTVITGSRIINNETSFNGGAYGTASTPGIYIDGGTNSYIGSNISWKNAQNGIWVTPQGTIDDSTIIELNTLYDNGHNAISVIAFASNMTNLIIRRNFLYNTSNYVDAGNSDFIFVSGITGTIVSPQIYYNAGYGAAGACIQLYLKVTGALIYNNAFYGTNANVTSWVNGIEIDTVANGCTTATIKNNVVMNIYSGTGGGDKCLYIPDSNSISALDNNLWYQSAGGTRVYTQVNATAYHFDDQAAYKAATGWDTSGKWEDPLFQSATDLRLKPTSPAINAGVDVGLTTDYSGRPIQLLPDMGAYEYEIRRRRVN